MGDKLPVMAGNALKLLRVNTSATALEADPGTYSTASAIAAIYAPLASPALTGIPAAPTAAVDTNTTQLATTGYVVGQGYLKSAAAAAIYAPLASPALTGIPAAPTAAVDTSTTQLATTAYVVGQGYLKSAAAATTYLPLAGGTVTGNMSVNGNTALGDAAADTLSVSGAVIKNATGNWVIPAPSSGVALTVNGTASFTGAITASGGVVGALTGNAATATALATARLIGGTSFDGSANIAVALAATATALATARTIGGTSFDGTANIAVALATAATTAGTVTTAAQPAITSVGTLSGLSVSGDVSFTGTLLGGTVPWARLSNVPVSNGVYTPTFTNVSGCSSMTATDVFLWTQVGDIVTVVGQITVNRNTFGTPAEFYFTLPVGVSAPPAAVLLSGTGTAWRNGGGTAAYPLFIQIGSTGSAYVAYVLMDVPASIQVLLKVSFSFRVV